ncbi:TetR/AcrR family transcriptional regulator [Rhodoferax sp. PAMC 29310]|uniref:TetR/AcrR family transcriptional regulator n=1 Tax=Rhodoferax sp. PAMC 29310 TaxID=2822760 RepID=UPI001F0A65EE|nr:TetR family transcriptional regulator [Rhodoferax sp. PAMC 29310]
MNTAPILRVSFKQQMLKAREEAIVQAVNRLLAEKGFDAMTVDEVAAQVGIAKASLYKHFSSKEDLAAAAMVRVLRQAQAFVETVPEALAPVEKLRHVVHWMLGIKLAGEMPALPNQNSALRTALVGNKDYMDALVTVSDVMGEWIEAAQAAGEVNPSLPAIAVLYTLYARACDPVVEFLKMGGTLTDDQVTDLVVSTCFDGLRTR